MQISEEKIKKIKEEILSILFYSSPNALFTSFIARELARDEEFTKKLLLDLESHSLIAAVRKSPKGKDYNRRFRWRLTERTYNAYKEVGGKHL